MTDICEKKPKLKGLKGNLSLEFAKLVVANKIINLLIVSFLISSGLRCELSLDGACYSCNSDISESLRSRNPCLLALSCSLIAAS